MRIIFHISLVFIFLYINPITAQIRVGVFGGINSTDFSGHNPPGGSFTSDYGFDLGTTADFYILDDIALNLQLNYSQQSTSLQYDVNYQYDKYDSISVKADYFDIPLNIKVISNNKMSYVTAGVSLAIPLNATVIDNRTGNEEDSLDEFEPYIIFANFGVGIQFSIGKPLLFIELLYSQSLTNLIKLNINEVDINSKLKSNSIRLYTGILFTL